MLETPYAAEYTDSSEKGAFIKYILKLNFGPLWQSLDRIIYSKTTENCYFFGHHSVK